MIEVRPGLEVVIRFFVQSWVCPVQALGRIRSLIVRGMEAVALRAIVVQDDRWLVENDRPSTIIGGTKMWLPGTRSDHGIPVTEIELGAPA